MRFRVAAFDVAVMVLACSAALAQMGGGMGSGGGVGSGGGWGNGSAGGNGIGIPAGMGRSGGMGMGSGMMNDVAVGPDGTAYVLRRTGQVQSGGMMQTGGTADSKTELVAIDGRSGSEKWTVTIDAEMVSEPAFAKDGRLILTAADVGFTQTNGAITAARKARLLVIRPAGAVASVTSTDVESDILSAPRIAPDESVVYATGFEMGGLMWNSGDSDSVPAGQTDLYGFTLDGTRKFKVTIGRSQFNLPPR